MNKTTVKRGIGAVLLALIAAGLLAFLLKDKAEQRQDLVDMPLPGSDSNQVADGTTKLPELSMDNTTASVNADGEVIASAGAENAGTTAKGVMDSTTGKIAASASAVGAGVAGAVGAVTSAGEKALDFNVRPPSTKSDEFRDLSDVDLVNNGDTAASTSSAATAASTAASTATTASSTSTSTPRPSNTTRGTVIASAGSGGGQARLIDERTATPPRSSRTERVVSSRPAANTAPKSTPAPAPKPAPALVAEKAATPAPAPVAAASNGNGYAIQLLATSSVSRAQSLVTTMRNEGYKAYFTKVTQNGKLLYRVRIGQYADKASADKAHQAMKRRYKKNADVNRSAVVRR